MNFTEISIFDKNVPIKWASMFSSFILYCVVTLVYSSHYFNPPPVYILALAISCMIEFAISIIFNFGFCYYFYTALVTTIALLLASNFRIPIFPAIIYIWISQLDVYQLLLPSYISYNVISLSLEYLFAYPPKFGERFCSCIIGYFVSFLFYKAFSNYFFTTFAICLFSLIMIFKSKNAILIGMVINILLGLFCICITCLDVGWR